MDNRHIAYLEATRNLSNDDKNYVRNVYNRLIEYVEESNRLRLKERHDIEKDLDIEQSFRLDLGNFEELKPNYNELANIASEYAINNSFLHPMYIAKNNKRREYMEFVNKKHDNLTELLSEFLGDDLSSDFHTALSQATNKGVWHLEQEMLLENLAQTRSLFLTIYSNSLRYKHHSFGVREILSITSAFHYAASIHKLDFMKLHVAAQRWHRSLFDSDISERFHDYCFVEAKRITDLFNLANFERKDFDDIPYFPKLYDFIIH